METTYNARILAGITLPWLFLRRSPNNTIVTTHFTKEEHLWFAYACVRL